MDSMEVLVRLCAAMRARRPLIKACDVQLLLCVARERNETAARYSQMTGIPSSYVAGLLRQLGPQDHQGNPGPGLVSSIQDGNDGCYTSIRWSLTAKGQTLVDEMTGLIESVRGSAPGPTDIDPEPKVTKTDIDWLVGADHG